MAARRFVEQLSEQVGQEFAAAQQYVANAVFYDARTLPRLAGFFSTRPSRSATTR